jgi:excinuclease ABC subunit B
MGRAARHVRGKAILYADRHTDSMKQAIGETNRRRAKQVEYNQENGITPESIIKPVDMVLASIVEADYVTVPIESEDENAATGDQLEELIRTLETRMREAAKQFEFEKAAQLRDRIKGLREKGMQS